MIDMHENVSSAASVVWLDQGHRRAPQPDRWVDEMLSRLAPHLPGRSVDAAHDDRPVRRGGQAAARAALETIQPEVYARTRNALDGAVTRLSPWLRHGVLSLAEVRDRALAAVDRPDDAEKLISELAWRDYWQRVYASLGEAIFREIEPPAATRRGGWIDRMPDDVLAGSTGMTCIDAFVRELSETGYLHNHARMWLAAWLVHARGVRWQAGAAWFLSHLLDGDPASNTLSWQWVAGTFSSKPYIFNRENLERFTDGRFCSRCDLAGCCDLEGGYEELTERWFAETDVTRPKLRIPPAPRWQSTLAAADDDSHHGTAVWLTLDSLGETSPAAARFPDAPRLFVFERAWLERERPTRKRLRFILECLADVDRLDVGIGTIAEGLPTSAVLREAGTIAVADTPCPFVRKAAELLRATRRIEVVEPAAFIDPRRIDDLGRFSRYWSRVRASAMKATPPGC
jgi:deoxyribodipyrimidine photo-lyase